MEKYQQKSIIAVFTGGLVDILDVLAAGSDTAAIEAEVLAKVSDVCARHPVYAEAVAEAVESIA